MYGIDNQTKRKAFEVIWDTAPPIQTSEEPTDLHPLNGLDNKSLGEIAARINPDKLSDYLERLKSNTEVPVMAAMNHAVTRWREGSQLDDRETEWLYYFLARVRTLELDPEE